VAVPIGKPSCFGNYVEGQALSSACKCLAVPTSSTTTTTILSIPTTTTTSTTVPLTIFATATATDTLTTTATITNTATETSTITEKTTIYTATLPAIAIPTFTVYAIGGPNSGNPIANAGGNIVGDARNLSPVLQFTTVDNNKLQVLNGPYAGSIAKTNPNAAGSGSYVYFGSTAAGLLDTTCQVTYNSDGTCPLSCQASRGTTSYDCGVYWRIGADADVGNCNRFTPYAVGG
jgi:hypothetical protein